MATCFSRIVAALTFPWPWIWDFLSVYLTTIVKLSCKAISYLKLALHKSLVMPYKNKTALWIRERYTLKCLFSKIFWSVVRKLLILNTMPLNSASLALWYFIVPLLILEIFQENVDHPVDKQFIFLVVWFFFPFWQIKGHLSDVLVVFFSFILCIFSIIIFIDSIITIEF